MDGLGNAFPPDMFGTDSFILSGSFAPNGVSAPLAAGIRTPPGLVWTVARTGVGLFVLTFDPSLTFPDLPYLCTAESQLDALANHFAADVIGEFNRTARTMTIQCHRSGVAQEVAAAAGARVNWTIMLRNSTSR